jgi:hypothetical protein
MESEGSLLSLQWLIIVVIKQYEMINVKCLKYNQN